MAVRNFWIWADIDGRKTHITGGPASKSGGIQLNLYQRSNGGGTSLPVLKIRCSAHGDELRTRIIDEEGNAIKEIVTRR